MSGRKGEKSAPPPHYPHPGGAAAHGDRREVHGEHAQDGLQPTRQWEEDGSYTFDAANAIKALTEIGKYLGVGEKAEESVREIRVDFGEHEEYAR